MKNWEKQIATFMASQTVSLLGSSLVMYAIVAYHTDNTIRYHDDNHGFDNLYSYAAPPPLRVWVWDRLNQDLMIRLRVALVTLIVAILFIFGIRDLYSLYCLDCSRLWASCSVAAVYPQIVPQDKLIKVQGIAQGIQSASMIAIHFTGLLLILPLNLY